MSAVAAQNRFAPPRAEVEDQYEAPAEMVEASRGSRFLAILIDGVLPAVIGIAVAVSRGDAGLPELQAGPHTRHRAAGHWQRATT